MPPSEKTAGDDSFSTFFQGNFTFANFNFMTYFVSDISNRPTDLSLSKGFSKNITVEDLQKFQEIPAYCGLDLMIPVL